MARKFNGFTDEEWGTCYKRIKSVCEKKEYTTPEWHEMGIAIRVVFRPYTATQEQLSTEEIPRSKSFSNRQENILKLIKKHEELRSKDIFNKLKDKVSERTVRLDLLELMKPVYLSRIGKGPSTRWILAAIA